MLERIVHHCLVKDPVARYQAARDVAFDLESLSALSSPPEVNIPAKKIRKFSLVSGVLLAASLLLVGLLIAHLRAPVVVPPRYRQLSFAHGIVRSARFAPDRRTVVYTSGRAGDVTELFSVTPDSLAPLNLGLKDADLAAISPSGEMLVIQKRRRLASWTVVGVLARVPMTGAAPRPILENVQDADWGPDKQIAAARTANGRFRLEYPIGHTIYETDGYISDVRVSPKGDLVAFADHPAFGDNGGTVAVVDSAGRKHVLTAPQQSILGLCWDPAGKEVWFSGTESGLAAQLKSLSLTGHSRLLVDAPGSLVINDVARDGTVLLRHESSRFITVAYGPDHKEQDMTVRDWTLGIAISPDGRQTLLEEEGTGSHPGNDLYVRSTDGSPPVRVGEGVGEDLSPDGKWVLASRGQLFLIPAGPGEPRQITHDAIEHDDARFLPGSKAVVFTGTEPGQKPRIYTQVIGADKPRAISPPGVRVQIPTADGKFVFGFSDTVSLYPVNSLEAPRAVLGLRPDDEIASVFSDGGSVLVHGKFERLPFDILRVHLADGRRQLFRKIGPQDPLGILRDPFVTFTPDGKYYVYTYNRLLSELYTVCGLH